ncbi:DsbA family protein [Desulfurobacterium atlanticum]|uniref:Thiol:disulfide interchange protein DsbC n=1 Tax=Desulfurobacterium atlanticum TaxID=240169 RepID=A0A238ZN04_9BACT|nr:hypothetical protein [Desulfurobacterium atlanticum]SNR84421.1 thiol:disulfide interchange protein DsbC [Desulfurobacterium atlanticum]
MKKYLYFLTVLALTTSFSCAQSSKTSKDVVSSATKEDVELVKKMFGHAAGRNLELVDVEPTNKTVTLRAYKVKFKDKKSPRYVYGYVWLSTEEAGKDGKGKIMTFKIYEITGESKDGMPLAAPIEPEKQEEMYKTDLSWFKKIVKELEDKNIPHTIGKGDKVVYIVWDVYCPFCYNNFGKVAKSLKEGIKLVFVPLPVHGETSVKGFVYYTYLARKEGAQKAMGHIFMRGDGNFGKFRRSFEEEVEKNYNKIPEKERKELEKFYRDIRAQLVKKGINATPTIVYIPPTEKDKGYIHRGFIQFDKLFELK